MDCIFSQLAVYDLRFLRPPRTTSVTVPRPRKGLPPGSHRRHDPPGGAERSVHAPPVPVVTMDGHINTFSTELGMDVWKDEWVAIGALLASYCDSSPAPAPPFPFPLVARPTM